VLHNVCAGFCCTAVLCVRAYQNMEGLILIETNSNKRNHRGKSSVFANSVGCTAVLV